MFRCQRTRSVMFCAKQFKSIFAEASTFVKSRKIVRLTKIGGLLGFCLFSTNSSALCDANSKESSANGEASTDEDANEALTKIFRQLGIDSLSDKAGELGISGALGLCAGLALKRIGREAATAVGVVFVLIQGLNYCGYIQINYAKVEESAVKYLDADGDGKLTSSDVKHVGRQLLTLLSTNLPSMSSFSSGFALGSYYG